MKAYVILRLVYVGVVFLGLIPGFSGLFLIEAAIAIILIGGATALANYKGFLPGTRTYENRLAVEKAENDLKLDRINRIRRRIQLAENQDMDKMLEAPKNDG